METIISGVVIALAAIIYGFGIWGLLDWIEDRRQAKKSFKNKLDRVSEQIPEALKSLDRIQNRLDELNRELIKLKAGK